MIIKIKSEADIKALTDILRPDNTEGQMRSGLSLPNLLSLAAEHSCPEGDNEFICIVAKELLSPSYRSNPSNMGLNILNKTPGFVAYAGNYTQTDVIISLFRKDKTNHYHLKKPSAKQMVRNWLAENPLLPFLQIELEDISMAFRARPEQLTYQVKCETGIKIKIKRFKTYWKITCVS